MEKRNKKNTKINKNKKSGEKKEKKIRKNQVKDPKKGKEIPRRQKNKKNSKKRPSDKNVSTMCKLEKSTSTSKIRSKRARDYPWLTPRPIYASNEQQTIQPNNVEDSLSIQLPGFQNIFEEIKNCFKAETNNRF